MADMTQEDALAFKPRRVLIDGVPVYTSAVPTPQSAIAIIFRVGAVDESLGYRGVTHLVEHLALRELRTAQYSFNGSVGFLRTTFTASGSPDELVAFTRGLCQNLRNLPLGELRRELQVLWIESQGRPAALGAHLMAIHCGYTPHGLMNMPELGLVRLRGSEVAEWAASRFTRDNVAVWVSGPMPDGLAFDLPRGARISIPEPTLVPTLNPPACVTGGTGGVALSALTDWSLALEVGTVACGTRLIERLRFKEGISYKTVAQVNPVTARTGHMIIAADCVNSAAEQAARLLFETVEAVAAEGPLESEIRPVLDNARRACVTPDALLSTLDDWAFRELTGREQRTAAETFALLAAIDGREAAQAMTRALERAVLVLPPDCPSPHQRFRPHVREARPIRGQTFWRERGALFSFGTRGPYITIGSDGVSYVNEKGEGTTVYFNRCAGLLKYGEDRRVLLGEDRESIEVVLNEWPDGLEIASRLDAAVPDDRIMRCS